MFSFKISQFKVGKKTEKPPSTDDDADIYLPGSRLLRRQRRTAVSNTRHRTRRGRSSGEQEAFASENYPARALRALGLLLADGAPTVGGGKTF